MKVAINEVLNMTWPTIVIITTVLVVMKITKLIKGEGRKFILHEEIFDLIFIIYLLILFQLVTSQDLTGGGVNLVPFKEMFRYDYGTSSFYKQVIGNILLFIPLGYFISHYCKLKGILSITLISFIISTVIECVQHFIGRCFDVDDIILNVIGGIFGFLIYIALRAIVNHLPKIFRKDWFYNILSIIFIILVIIYLVLKVI